jgi:DNA-binding MarR family transcriptional regulator
MFGNGNVPGQPPVQKPIVPEAAPPPPANSIYEKKWSFPLPANIQESLTAPGMPSALLEYRKGWDDWSGVIPTDRKDMWSIFYNYYLNTIQDNDRSLQQIVDTINEMDLWRDTVVVFTADHGEMGGAHGGLKGKGPFSYEENAHVPLLIAHPAGKTGATSSAITSHLDLLPTFVGLTGLPDAKRPPAVKALPGHDFSALLADPEKASLTAVRPAALFNYVGPSTVDGDYLGAVMSSLFYHKPSPSISGANLDKRGFLSFVFDGRYKFARYYAPSAFNTPHTLEEILRNNDVQLFDLANDPEEVRNLAIEPEKNRATILQMNELLNDLIAKEVGVNDGRFLAQIIAVGTAAAQMQRDGTGAVTLTPEQRAMVRAVIGESLADEMRERLADRIADALSQLSPEQREALRSTMRQRLAAEVREGLSDRLADRIAGGLGEHMASGITSERVSGEIRESLADRLAQLTPEQRAVVRNVIRERVADELRERLPERIAEGLSQLTPEQRQAVRSAIREGFAAEIREGLSDRLSNRLSGAIGGN